MNQPLPPRRTAGNAVAVLAAASRAVHMRSDVMTTPDVEQWYPSDAARRRFEEATLDTRDGWLVAWGLCCEKLLCYTEKASPTRHRPERQHNARANRRKQCSPNETKPYSKPTLPRKMQTTPTNGHTPRRWKPTHTRLTYTRMRPHAPSHQAGDHPVPAHTELHNVVSVCTPSDLPRPKHMIDRYNFSR